MQALVQQQIGEPVFDVQRDGLEAFGWHCPKKDNDMVVAVATGE
jgi:hypothetical protein